MNVEPTRMTSSSLVPNRQYVIADSGHTGRSNLRN